MARPATIYLRKLRKSPTRARFHRRVTRGAALAHLLRHYRRRHIGELARKIGIRFHASLKKLTDEDSE